MSAFLTYTAVYAVLEKDGKVYVMRRANIGYRDGQYSLPAGHVEAGETLLDAVVREVKEETGLEVGAKNLQLAHNMFRQNPDRTYNDYFFVCRDWQGQPANAEPEKCDDTQWLDLQKLPENIVPEVKHALRCIADGEKFSQLDLRKADHHDRAN